MVQFKKTKTLKKELRLLDVYAIATGTTLSAGFFLLPGLAAQLAGPAMVIAYVIAAIPLIPAMFSIVELGTAMPRAGGVYYFLDRTMGPMVGTIGGVGTYLALILKVSFALIGMGAYINLFIPDIEITPFAIIFAIALGFINYFGAKQSGKLQIILVAGLLAILAYFIGRGIPSINYSNFNNFFREGFDSLIATSGLVYISYVGITKVASVSEEVKNPEKNLPLGIFLALGTAIIVYIIGTAIMVGVVPIDKLMGDLTPVALAADHFMGKTGIILVSIAAIFAFISVANAGTMSASRYPLAMSRDHMMPKFFKKIGKTGTPLFSIMLTTYIIILILFTLNPMKIAKLASAFQLLMFALVCLAVIVMRESKLDSYDPGYKSPFYPYMQIFGIISAFWLIAKMGLLPTLFTAGLVLVGIAWYWFYAKNKVVRQGAIYHIFERLGRQRYDGLDSELRGILKEKGLRKEDPFDEIVARSLVIDLEEKIEFDDLAGKAGEWLSTMVPYSSDEIKKEFMEGTKIGATPVTHGIALPHLRINGLSQPEMVLVRSKGGVHIVLNSPLTDHKDEEHIVNAVFFLTSPEQNPSQHLRILAQIAGRVDDESFSKEWKNAKDEQELKESLLHDERMLALKINHSEKTSKIIGKALKEIHFPEGTLVAILRREGQSIVPKGKTVILNGDRLTIIGDPEGLKEIEEKYTLKNG